MMHAGFRTQFARNWAEGYRGYPWTIGATASKAHGLLKLNGAKQASLWLHNFVDIVKVVGSSPINPTNFVQRASEKAGKMAGSRRFLC